LRKVSTSAVGGGSKKSTKEFAWGGGREKSNGEPRGRELFRPYKTGPIGNFRLVKGFPPHGHSKSRGKKKKRRHHKKREEKEGTKVTLKRDGGDV